ncbi:uncharacterized protein B0J16DRAFT_321588 [Fusarium flagelliforme]|uniref:uncharacterized protein n=1 Tax=Fusarium flagelliforme TaxID=2675880 RepID=UPI001E8CD8EC|nr:uncharacterized protein B0J16DRAFT_321588 [Fusarium flagelliforme]KAH7182823.1 hypothetical protein B0J16DRAFT_321588 [Fusarium flagelliforme]
MLLELDVVSIDITKSRFIEYNCPFPPSSSLLVNYTYSLCPWWYLEEISYGHMGSHRLQIGPRTGLVALVPTIHCLPSGPSSLATRQYFHGLLDGPKLPSTTASSSLTLRLHPFAASGPEAKSSQAKPNQNQNQRNATQLHTNPPPANLPTYLPQAASTTILTSTTYVRHQNNKAPTTVSRYRLVLHLATPTLPSTPTDTDTDLTFSASLPPALLP